MDIKTTKEMDSLPLVSIGVPVYNGEEDLPRSLASLLCQTYSKLEIIISDNASTDRTEEIAREFAACDGRIRYHRLERNIGANGNFDRLRHLATGEFFMWNGADDLRPPEAVQSLVDALQNDPKAVMAHGPIIARLRQQNLLLSNTMDLSASSSSQRVRTLTTQKQHNAMEYGLYRLEAIRRAAYESHGRYGDDYLICLQMAFLGPIAYVPTPMIVYCTRTVTPPTPLGEAVPMERRHLLLGAKRMWKAWSVLIWGCVYLLRFQHVGLSRRFMGMVTHLVTFVARHKKRLMVDAVVIVVSSLVAIPHTVWKGVRRVLPLEQLDSRMKSFLNRV